ncbi:MAG TPA: STAS domain-containing protein [Leptospiraceae bacterium]|nr:STAS domain-containing protein [Leptospiraceae bacterium]HRG76280.1 STAS domain-containing protein [Leptospiraceae bacterium]
MLDVSINQNHLSETQVVFVNLKGALDSEKAIDYYDFINAELIKGFRKFIVDCSNLDYISSAGISIMIRLQHKLAEKKSILAYFAFNKEISLVLDFFGLKKEFPIADTSVNALKLLNPGQDEFSEEEIIYSVHSDAIDEKETPNLDKPPAMDTKEQEPIQVQVSEARVASLLEPEIAKKIISNRLTITEDYPVVEDEPEPTSSIEPVQTEPILEAVTPKYSELKIKLPFITRTETNPAKTTIMDSITDFETDHTERYDVSSLSQATDTNFTVLVVNCGNCGSKIRIRKQGKQQCPRCEYKFLLRQSGSISTIERL